MHLIYLIARNLCISRGCVICLTGVSTHIDIVFLVARITHVALSAWITLGALALTSPTTTRTTTITTTPSVVAIALIITAVSSIVSIATITTGTNQTARATARAPFALAVLLVP